MKINIGHLEQFYFTFDKPVDYQIKNGKWIKIYPIFLQDATNFLFVKNILTIDKNTSSDIEIIQMSYLQFLYEHFLSEKSGETMFAILLKLCLNIEFFEFGFDKNGKIYFSDVNDPTVVIGGKDFDEIKKIILYQNILHYDDQYIPPDLKNAIEEVDALKNKNFDPPSLERKIAIISAHTGISKKEQIEMTLRSHSLLFEEVCGEVDYLTFKPIAIYGGKGNEVQWINKRKQGKYDGYFVSDEKYSRSMGGDGHIKKTEDTSSSNMIQSYNNFN